MIVGFSAIVAEEGLEDVTKTPCVMVATIRSIKVNPIKSEKVDHKGFLENLLEECVRL